MIWSGRLFGISRPTNSTFVRSSSIRVEHARIRRHVEVREVRHDRQDAGRRKSERGKFLPIEFRGTEREVDRGCDRAAAPGARESTGARATDGRPTKYSGGVMLWYTSIIGFGSANAVRDARDPIEK